MPSAATAKPNRRPSDQPSKPSKARGTASPSPSLLRRLTVKNSRGGVAPFVPPANRMRRRLLLRRWHRRGFIPLSPGRAKARHRVLPRTVIGISFMLLSLAAGAAFSGAAFYAYYDNRLADNEASVARFVEGFDRQFADASGAIDELRVEAISDIRTEFAPLGEYVSDSDGVVNLPAIAGPSIWVLETKDDAGRPVVGSAFAVVPHRGGTAFITSLELVDASTATPAPPIELVKGGQRLVAQLWTWDVDNDLAVVVVEEEIEKLALAGDDRQVSAVGRPVFALSGLGGQGASASPGVVLDHAEHGLQHTAAVGSFFVGGPLLTGDSAVVGMASLSYEPYGIDHGAVLAAPDVQAFCQRVLSCVDIVGGTAVVEVTGEG